MPEEAEPRVTRLYQKVSSLLQNKQKPPNFLAFLENYPAKDELTFTGAGLCTQLRERCELLLSSQ